MPRLSSVHGLNANEPAGPGAIDEERFEFCWEFDPGHGGAYGLALNSDATRLYVAGEGAWLDILDISETSAIQSIAQGQFEDMPYGEDGKYGIAYDPHFERVVVAGGSGGKVFLIDVSGDELHLLDAAFPPEIQFPGVEFPLLRTTAPLFIKEGSAIAAAMQTGGQVVDPSSGENVYFGEGVYVLSIDPVSHKMSVVHEGIGGVSTMHGLCYDPARDLIWCGGRDGSEAIIQFSQDSIAEYRYWWRQSGDWRSRVMPDVVTRDGKWLVERVASDYPLDHWFIRMRQIEAGDGSYSVWNVEMPTDGATPHLLGSPINWDGDTEDPGSRISSRPLLPCVLTHDEMHVITAEAGGNELLVLDLSDKTTEPQVVFSKMLGEQEQIQSIKGYRNRFYVSLKSGKVVAYQWNFVPKPEPPAFLTAVSSPSDQSVCLSWDPPSLGVSPVGYNVYRRTASSPLRKMATVAQTAWTDESTGEGTTYIYTVRSFAPEYSPIESDDSSDMEATSSSGIPPKKVLGVSGKPTLCGVSLSWIPNVEADVVGYFVYRKTGEDPFSKITSSPLAEAQFVEAGLKEGENYSYYVTAVDGELEGAPSDTITLTAGSETGNLLLNASAEQQCAAYWSNVSTTFSRDPANRYCFANDLFISVTNAIAADGQWAFWADQTCGRLDRETSPPVNETYLLGACQDVDVSVFSTTINSQEREIVADWGGKVIRSNASESVFPSLAIEFLDIDGTVIERHELSTEEVGDWIELSSSAPVPACTTCIRFRMFARDVGTSAVNAAWDDLRLILRALQPQKPLAVNVSNHAAVLTVSFGPTVPGTSYQIEYCDLLSHETTAWKACGPCFNGDGEDARWDDSPDEQIDPTYPPVCDVKTRFYRVRQQ